MSTASPLRNCSQPGRPLVVIDRIDRHAPLPQDPSRVPFSGPPTGQPENANACRRRGLNLPPDGLPSPASSFGVTMSHSASVFAGQDDVSSRDDSGVVPCQLRRGPTRAPAAVTVQTPSPGGCQIGSCPAAHNPTPRPDAVTAWASDKANSMPRSNKDDSVSR